VLNPATTLQALDEILPELDFVLLMSVNPGFGGQRFITSTLNKIQHLKQRISDRQLRVAIEIDGGVNPSNAAHIRQAGADILVAGTAIFGQDNYADAIHNLRR
jgi:ribulose-phosphate 3-epimerase